MKRTVDPSLPAREGVTALTEFRCCAGQVLIQLRAARPGLVIPPWVIHETRFEFTVQGSFRGTCDDHPMVGRAGRCLYRPPGRRAQGVISDEGLVELVVAFAPSAGGGADPFGHPALVTLAARILSELLRGGARHSELDVLAARCQEVVDRTRVLHEDRAPWIRSVVNRLRDVHSEPPTLAELSHLAGVHRAHLSRTFRRQLGTTPGQYRRLVVLQGAATRLASTDQTLADIAFDCGFADQSHFGRHFLRAFGLPPGSFRALMSDAPGAPNSRPFGSRTAHGTPRNRWG